MAKDKENTTPEKSKKSDKKKPGKIAKWFKDLRSEFKKVVWPSKQTVVTNTSVVLAVVVLASAIVGLLDAGFLTLMDWVYNR